jgi:hypothetical protein
MDAVRAAEEIRAKAQEEAAAILRDARARAAAMGAGGSPREGGPPSGVGPFLQAEREFLHGLGGMIKRHAESITDMARRMQQAQVEAGPGDRGGRTSAPSASSVVPGSPTAGNSAQESPKAASAAAGEVQSAWAATGTAVPAATATEEEPTIVSIPPSPVDTPGEASPTAPADGDADEEDGRGRSAPNDQRSLRELFWGEE